LPDLPNITGKLFTGSAISFILQLILIKPVIKGMNPGASPGPQVPPQGAGNQPEEIKPVLNQG